MNDMRYIITEYCHRDIKGILAFSLDTKTDKMESVNFTSYDQYNESITIGDIFVAKVLNVSRKDICPSIQTTHPSSPTAAMTEEF